MVIEVSQLDIGFCFRSLCKRINCFTHCSRLHTDAGDFETNLGNSCRRGMEIKRTICVSPAICVRTARVEIAKFLKAIFVIFIGINHKEACIRIYRNTLISVRIYRPISGFIIIDKPVSVGVVSISVIACVVKVEEQAPLCRICINQRSDIDIVNGIASSV